MRQRRLLCRQDADGGRDAFMESHGLKLMRVAAADVLAGPETVADGIYRVCDARVGPSTTQPDG